MARREEPLVFLITFLGTLSLVSLLFIRLHACFFLCFRFIGGTYGRIIGRIMVDLFGVHTTGTFPQKTVVIHARVAGSLVSAITSVFRYPLTSG